MLIFSGFFRPYVVVGGYSPIKVFSMQVRFPESRRFKASLEARSRHVGVKIEATRRNFMAKLGISSTRFQSKVVEGKERSGFFLHGLEQSIYHQFDFIEEIS